MAVKNDIDITIGGKTITLSGVESEDYLREVASYLNGKLREFADDASYWRLPNDMRNVMLQLNLADDYFKEHSRVAELEAQVQSLEEHRDKTIGELENMQSAAQEAAARINTLESDTADLRDQVQRAAAAENSASKRFGAEKSRAEKLAEELEALKKSKAEADKAVERFRNELAQARENQTKTLRERESTMQKTMADTREEHSRQLKAAKSEAAEREKQMEKAFNDTREELSRQVKAARTESAAREKALEKAEQEIEKLREQCLDARQSAETAQKKLGALQKEFDSKLAAGTAQFRTQVQDAQQALEKTQEELTVLQEQENNRSQAAARVRATMQELVQQYGRFGQSLEEASEQMRTLQ